MGVELYQGKQIPVFESTAVYNKNLYGLALGVNEDRYYFFDISPAPLRCKCSIKIDAGTRLELEVNSENKLGVRSFLADGKDDGFSEIPAKYLTVLE